MKIAIVHDWFNKRVGGAEQVTFELAKMFPDAPVFTLLYNKQIFSKLLDESRVRTSFLQKMPASIKKRPRYLLPLIPKAVASLDFRSFKIVISVSSAFVKNIHLPDGTVHICYCNTPMRFGWDYREQYLIEQQLGLIRRQLATQITKRIKAWDKAGSQEVDVWLANSKTVAKRINKYYQQTAEVVYPPVGTQQFQPKSTKSNYYLTLSGLTPYKKIDLAIAACNELRRPLIVAGDGTDRTRLQKLAGPTIKFTGHVSESQKRQLLQNARALIYPNEEDFGIAPVEAMAAGTPVIGYNKGGLTESVIHGETGILFNNQTPQGLSAAIMDFESRHFDSTTIVKQAAKFDAAIFTKRLRQIVKEANQYVSPN